MQKMILSGMIGLMAPILLAAGNIQPLKVKPGLWQETITSTTSGQPPIPPGTLDKLTPEQRAKFEAAVKGRTSKGPQTRTFNHCVTQEDLNKDPFGEDKKSCTRTVLASTGSKMDVHAVCTGNGGVKTDFTVHIEALDSENVKASVHVNSTGGGRAMNGDSNITGKWLGAACPGKK
jgi:uncharacterized protein DUF3617